MTISLQPTCAKKTVLVVEGVDTSTVPDERRSLKCLLVLQLHHAQLGLEVDTLPVGRILDGVIDAPAQVPTHALPHLRARADHLKGCHSSTETEEDKETQI